MAEGKLGSFLNFFKIDEEDDLDNEDELEYDDAEDFEPEYSSKKKFGRKKSTKADDEDDFSSKQKVSHASKPKVVPMHSTSTKSIMEVNIIKPTSFEDSQDICNTLLSARPVVVNLEGFDPDDAQRIMDFISGCIYAINGKFHQISKYIFIFTPANVDISGDSLTVSSEGFGSVPTINREF